MGVTGLLQALAIQGEEVVWPAKARGAAVGVDISAWLHELATLHHQKVVLLKDVQPVVTGVLERARAYVMSGVQPVFVFDGRRLPGKAGTDEARAAKRLEAEAVVAAALDDSVDLSELQAAIAAGQELPVDIEDKTLKAAVAVDDHMNTTTLRALRRKGFRYIKAPYEADAQLACLDRLDITQYTETVDSDLLVYGVRRVAIRTRRSAKVVQPRRRRDV